MKQCINCGKTVEDNYAFCPVCRGSEFIQYISNPNAGNTQEVYDYQNSNPYYQEQEIYGTNYNTQKPAKSKKQKKSEKTKKSKDTKSLKIAIYIGIILIIAAAVVALLIIKPWGKRQTSLLIYKNLLEEMQKNPVETISKYTDINQSDLNGIDISNDNFAINDINADGKPELIVRITSTSEDYTILFTADEKRGEAYAINTLPADTEFHNDGYAISVKEDDDSTEKLVSGYNEETGCYESILETSESSDGAFNYREYIDGEVGQWISATAEEIRELIEKYLNGDIIIPDYINIIQENIEKILSDSEDDGNKIQNTLEYKKETIVPCEIGDCHYEKITFSGTYAGIDKINEALDDYNHAFLTTITEYKEDAEGCNRQDYIDEFVNRSDIVSVWENGTVVSVCTEKEYFTISSPHGATTYEGRTFDLKTGEELKKTELFGDLTEDEFKSVLLKNTDEFLKDEESNNESAKKMIENNLNEITYYLGNDGFHLVFNVYEVAPYMRGTIDIVIPLSEFNSDIKIVSDSKNTYVSEFAPKKLTSEDINEIVAELRGNNYFKIEDNRELIKQSDELLKKVIRGNGFYFENYYFNEDTVTYIMTTSKNKCLYVVEESHFKESGSYVNGVQESNLWIVVVDPEIEDVYSTGMLIEGYTVYSHGLYIDEAHEKTTEFIISTHPEYSDYDLTVYLFDDYIYVMGYSNRPYGVVEFNVDYNFKTVKIIENN